MSETAPADLPRHPSFQPWRRLLANYWLLLIAISLALLLFFSKLTKEVVEGQLTGVDQEVRAWILAHRTPGRDHAFAVVSLLGSGVASLLIAIAATTWLWIRKQRRGAAVFASAPVVATLLFLSVKQLVRRQRPAGAAAIVTNYSFPSGHMTATTGLWVTLMYLVWRERMMPLPVALLIGVGWPLLVGLSRVYLDLHWASDVGAGWLLGLGLTLAATAVYEHWRARQTVTHGRK